MLQESTKLVEFASFLFDMTISQFLSVNRVKTSEIKLVSLRVTM